MSDRVPSKPKTPEICPVCGEDVPRGSLACPECGADHQSGWREDAAIYDAADLPDDEFDYGEFVREEFGSGSRSRGTKTVWSIAALLLLIVLVTFYFRGCH